MGLFKSLTWHKIVGRSVRIASFRVAERFISFGTCGCPKASHTGQKRKWDGETPPAVGLVPRRKMVIRKVMWF